MALNEVAVLFARQDSIYKSFDGVDVWDADRDARLWAGGSPVVAHPPCRAWGRLRAFANPRPDEKALAIWAVGQVREYGGVLEHPAFSTLWPAAGLPAPGGHDAAGGWTLPVSQNWWGHKAQKNSWLYIVGISPAQLPVMPLVLGEASHIVSGSGRRLDGSRSKRRPEITKAEREHSPLDFALWLVELARKCKPGEAI